MKAKIKATGEVFEIASYATIPMECCDSFGESLRFCFDEVEILSEGNDLKESDAPDYWARLEHQAAIAAMQGMIRTVGHDRMYPPEKIAIYAEACAHALVEKLKESK